MPLHAKSLPHIMNSLTGPTAPRNTYLIFYSSIVDGKMWCPDCRAVEAPVKEAFDGDNKPYAVIYWVGDKPEWRTPTNKARVDYNISSVPTILRLENGKETARLVEDEILDKARFAKFLKPEGDSE